MYRFTVRDKLNSFKKGIPGYIILPFSARINCYKLKAFRFLYNVWAKTIIACEGHAKNFAKVMLFQRNIYKNLKGSYVAIEWYLLSKHC